MKKRFDVLSVPPVTKSRKGTGRLPKRLRANQARRRDRLCDRILASLRCNRRYLALNFE